jgi:acyl-lipid omega-6 desaturase (Delta-12 desaturase)
MPEVYASGDNTIPPCEAQYQDRPARRSQSRPEWVLRLKRFERAETRKAIVQLANTLFPYLGLLTLMYLTIAWHMPYWVTLLLAFPASGFMVRLFIFFHDCSHGSYLPVPRATKILGTLLGIIVFTPFAEWRQLHVTHHSTSGNLDRRGIGDVWTLTVKEYMESSRFRRLLYRLFRHPLIMFGIGPLYMLLIAHRLPSSGAGRDQIRSVYLTNAALAGIVTVAAFSIGLKAYLMIMLPVMMIAGSAGVWLFYVQHQFEDSYFEKEDEWSYVKAAVDGSSYYKLPKLLQWITGNIGFHHVHHLSPKVPNYNLEKAHKAVPPLQQATTVTMGASFKGLHFRLWDEQNKTFVGFSAIKRLPMNQGTGTKRAARRRLSTQAK